MKTITVVGSLNVDYMIQNDHLPMPGETLFADTFQRMPGGKGMNQAVCCADLGNQVHMIGCVGKDDQGRFLLDQLHKRQIDTSGIYQVDAPTGCAFVATSPKDNSIMVVKGANNHVCIQQLQEQEQQLFMSDMIIAQFEIPMETVFYLIDFCYRHQKPLLINPAPVHALSKEYMKKITYLTPNEKEFAFLYSDDMETIMKEYPNKLIMTAGGNGVYAHDGKALLHILAEAVQVVDTTGAGDAFNGAFASAIVHGLDFGEALVYANHIAACAIQHFGAQSIFAADSRL